MISDPESDTDSSDDSSNLVSAAENKRLKRVVKASTKDQSEQPRCWADVRIEDDRRRLDIAEGADEENRTLVRSEADMIAHGEAVPLDDPLTGQKIDTQITIDKFKVPLESLYP